MALRQQPVLDIYPDHCFTALNKPMPTLDRR